MGMLLWGDGDGDGGGGEGKAREVRRGGMCCKGPGNAGQPS